MRDRGVRGISPATVISVVALFVAIGGTGYAATKINTQDIASRAVTGPKIKGKAIGSGKLKEGSIKGIKLADDTVTGNKIDESTLGEVPSAASVPYTRPFFIRLDLAQSEAIAVNGNVALVASCVEPAPGDTTARIAARTSDDQTVLNGDDNYDGSTATGFMPADAPEEERVLMSQTSSGQPGQTDVDGVIDNGFVVGGDGKGLSVDAETTMLGINYLGARCVVSGMVSFMG